MRDHHHYHYLFAKQRATLGPFLIGFKNCNEHLAFGADMLLERCSGGGGGGGGGGNA